MILDHLSLICHKRSNNVCVQGTGQTVAELHADRASLSDQDAIRPVGGVPLTSEGRQQRRHQPAAVMGDPGLLQELPDITALLPEAGGDGEQPAAADRTLAGLDTMTDLALNHGLAQSTLGCVVGGLDTLDVQECPQGLAALQQLLAGAHRSGPRRSLTAPAAQMHHPLQRGLEFPSDRTATLLQRSPVDGSSSVAVPVVKQLLLQNQQL